MPEALRRWPWIALAAIAMPAAVAAAQDMRELARRVDSAVASRNRAQAEGDAYRRARIKASVYPDTVAMVDGNVLVVTAHEFLLIVRDGAAHADSLIRPRVGAQDSLLRGTVLRLRTDSARSEAKTLIIAYRIGVGESPGSVVAANPAAVARAIEERLIGLLVGHAPLGFRKWGGAGIPIDPATDAEWRSARLELAASTEPTAHRCYAGDIGACKTILSVSPSATVGGYPRARGTLMQEAMALGGAGSVGRVVSTQSSVSDMIAAGAKAPIDTVVSRWLRDVRERGIESDAFNPVIGLVAIGWVIVMALLALRSSRWR
jgi:hypothetical protein